MFLIGLARLGKDGELRHLPDGRKVLNLALAFNYGKKVDGKQPTQWIDAAMFGDRAERLQPFMVKGQMIEVHLADPHIESYTSRDGKEGSKLTAFINHLEFAGSPPQGQQQAAPAPRPAPAPAPQPQARPAPNFSDMDDLIPF